MEFTRLSAAHSRSEIGQLVRFVEDVGRGDLVNREVGDLVAEEGVELGYVLSSVSADRVTESETEWSACMYLEYRNDFASERTNVLVVLGVRERGEVCDANEGDWERGEEGRGSSS